MVKLSINVIKKIDFINFEPTWTLSHQAPIFDDEQHD